MARYVITDIHGCLKTFRTLLEDKLKLKKTDTLYLLGDYVNKGPDSKGVLDYLMALQQEHYDLICLRGNHDQFLVDAAEKGDANISLAADDRQSALQSFQVERLDQIPEKYINFLKSLLYCYELPEFVLVHAGFDFSGDFRKSDLKTMLNVRNVKPDIGQLDDKKIVHGHVPVTLLNIYEALQQDSPEINLDAGCVYYRNTEFGHLTALDLDTLRLTVQDNLDQPYPIKIKE